MDVEHERTRNYGQLSSRNHPDQPQWRQLHCKTQRVYQLSNVYDSYRGQMCYSSRNDLLCFKICQPVKAPQAFYNLQALCDAMEDAEKRSDARTAREFIGSLPNELTFQEWHRIIEEYIVKNFVSEGLCVIYAIHEGNKASDPSKRNPHVHALVSTRTVGPEGFSVKKPEKLDQIERVRQWRKEWADVQNRAYMRCGLDIRVSHERHEERGIDLKPTIHLSRADWEKEQCGIRTEKGDRKREIAEENQEKLRKLEQERCRSIEIELDR